MDFLEILENSPVIAAVRCDEDLEKCFKTSCRVIFILYGTICTIPGIIERVKAHGKIAIVHMDFITGLSIKDIAVEFLSQNNTDGIISTKPNLVKEARNEGLIAIQRTFIVDSIAIDSLGKQISLSMPSAIEIMPGIMPDIIRKITSEINIPVIAGGLLSEKRHVISALSAGADAVSTTNHSLWYV